MKPFNLEEAKAGKPLITRDGRDAKFIAHVPEAKESFRILFLTGENVFAVCESGLNSSFGVIDDIDLFMKTVKKTVYVNLYASGHGYWYTDKLKACAPTIIPSIAIAVPIEIEE